MKVAQAQETIKPGLPAHVVAQRVTRWLTLAAAVACFCILAYVVGYFVVEHFWPPAPVALSPAEKFFGRDDGYRTHRLITPAMRWIRTILFLIGNAQLITAGFLSFASKPAFMRACVALLLMALAAIFQLASSLSCGC